MDDGRYTLNKFGRAGVQLLQKVEEPVTINAVVSNSRQGLLLKILSIAIIVIMSFSTWSLYSSNQVLKADLIDQRIKVETLQSYLQTFSTRAPTFKIIPDQARYYVGDKINATLTYINPTNQSITIMPPSRVHYSGHYVGEDDNIKHEVFFSSISSNFGGVKILPGHVFDVLTMTFTCRRWGHSRLGATTS